MERRRKTACLCAAVILLAGCAKSPENDIVARKNTEALVSKATEADEDRKTLAESKEQTLEHYNWNYDNGAGTLHIDVDADVALPETDMIPMYRLSCTGFTQEQVTGLYDYLFQGRETFRREGESYTKADCEKDIIKARKQLEETKQDTSVPEGEREQEQVMENQQSYLDDLLDRYDSLPEESQEKKVPVDSPGWPSLGYMKTGKYRYDPDIGLPVTPQEANEKKAPDLPYTYEEAKALADEVPKSMGIEAELVQAGLVKGYTEVATEDEDNPGIKAAEGYTAFQFQYARIVDGIPVAVTSSQYVSDDEAALIWPYETIVIVVSEAGIQEISWGSPVSLDETVANDVPILSFEKAKAVFEELAPLAHEGKIEERSDEEHTVALDVHVNQVRLCLMRVKNDGSKRQGLYVPAWVFYGTEATDWNFQSSGPDGDDEPDREPTPLIVLAVNAVDGTVIDQVEGY